MADHLDNDREWSPKWTIRKLHNRRGRPLNHPWHAIPPYTPLPGSTVDIQELAELYHHVGVKPVSTHHGALAYACTNIQEAHRG